MKPNITDLNKVASFSKKTLEFFGHSFQYAETGPHVGETALSTKLHFGGKNVNSSSYLTISVDGKWNWYANLKIVGQDYEQGIDFQTSDLEEACLKIDQELFRKMPVVHDRVIVSEGITNRMLNLAGIDTI